MVRALVLVRVASAPVVSDVVVSARQVEGVTEAFPVFGRFDVAVFVEARNFSEIGSVVERVRRIKGVRSTETLPEAF
jgi:hypothetical protein